MGNNFRSPDNQNILGGNMEEKILNKEEFKALLSIFGGVTSERVDELFFKGIVSLDTDTGNLWIKVPLEIEELQDPDFKL